MKLVSSVSFASKRSRLLSIFGIYYLLLDCLQKYFSHTDGPLCLTLTDAGLAVVSQVSKVHKSWEGARKIGWDYLPPADEGLDKLAVDSLVSPFGALDSPCF